MDSCHKQTKLTHPRGEHAGTFYNAQLVPKSPSKCQVILADRTYEIVQDAMIHISVHTYQNFPTKTCADSAASFYPRGPTWIEKKKTSQGALHRSSATTIMVLDLKCVVWAF